VKCAPITSLVSKTKGQFHEYNQEGALEERLELVSRMAGGQGADAPETLRAKHRLVPVAAVVEIAKRQASKQAD
jgi:hypothetical protein